MSQLSASELKAMFPHASEGVIKASAKSHEQEETSAEKFDSIERYSKEKDLQDKAEQWLKANGYMVLYRARMDVPTTAQKGISDILALKDGRFYAMEAKIGRNKPSAEQNAYLLAVHISGGIALVFYSLEELIAILK